MSKFLSSPVRAQSLVEAVTQRLEGAIMSGEFAPGSRLSEHALANALGVSRGPLREAIRRLEGRKLLMRTPNVGVHVAELSTNKLIELLFVREALEGLACNLATQKMSDDDIDALDELLKKHGAQESVQSGAGYYQAMDFDFHFLVARASGNDQLVQMLTGDLYDLLRVYRYRSSTLAGRAKKAHAEHQAVVAALRARDPQRAEAAMREHIRNARLLVESRWHIQERERAASETPDTIKA
jgi:DNA-binding GntR family transcriptional regulator